MSLKPVDPRSQEQRAGAANAVTGGTSAGELREIPGLNAVDATETARRSPLKMQNPAAPHPPRPENPLTPRNKAPQPPAGTDLLWALPGYEALALSMARLEDPHAQPDIPIELMQYTRDAEDLAYGRVPGATLFGNDAGPHVEHVRLNMSRDGALGAAIAAVTAQAPAHVRKLIVACTPINMPEPLFAGTLYINSVERPGQQKPVRLLTDAQVPIRGDGTPLGHNALPAGSMPLWHLLLAKLMGKLDDVLVHSQHPDTDPDLVTPRCLTHITDFLRTLSGTHAHEEHFKTGNVQQWRRALHSIAQSQAPVAAAITFRDAWQLHRLDCAEGFVESVFSGLGLRVRGADTDAILLSGHYYAVVETDLKRNMIKLYNPLGWNPDAQLAGETRASQFIAPEQLDAMPKAPGAFWLSTAWLPRIGLTLSHCPLP